MSTVNPDPTSLPDDITLHNYEDGNDTSDDIADRIMDEETDDPTKDLGVDPREFKAELDRYDFENGAGAGEDDRREDIENRDMDEGDSTKY